MKRLFALIFLLVITSCTQWALRGPSSWVYPQSCQELASAFAWGSMGAKKQAEVLEKKFIYQDIHLDLGGEGLYKGAININPQPYTSTTGEPYRLIPNWVKTYSNNLPFADSSVSRVTIENSPMNEEVIHESFRVLKKGGELETSHPFEFAQSKIELFIEIFGRGNVKFKRVSNGEVLEITAVKP